MMHDCFGLPLTAGDAAAVRHYDSALRKLLVLRNDPVAEVDAALRIDPGMVMGHVLKGLLCVLGSEKSLLADAHSALKAGLAVATGATPREHGHLAALSAWVGGRLHEACACWERVLVAQPDDALAMFAAHQGDFFLGQSSELRDRVATLTAREREVLDLVIEGISTKEMARRLIISPRTVEVHRSRIMRKMAMKSLRDTLRIALALRGGAAQAGGSAEATTP